ncbi:neprilysin-2-like [Belonocnema kinseyi]|uniref:neprilysin-2-like n=1 Tax=Belonocnema kinseyi TaxID=2817044 RepID=UPI00143DC1A6|nr:neprilysin-2-like [Belonocnema kinseyi]XP_033211545.1 neprilysin-2-like [Belonocnema kinseyi]
MKKFRMLYFIFFFGLLDECKVLGAETNEPASSNVCTNTECQDFASMIRQFMNPKVDPCDNFYQFACGNYTQNAVIPKDEGFINRDSFIEEKVKNQLKISIEEGIQTNEPRFITLAKNLYNGCMNTSAIEENGLKTVLDEFKELGGWPVLEEDSWKEEKFDWKNTTYAMGKLGYGTNYLFDFKPSVDLLNSSRLVLTIDQPALSIGREYLIEGFNNKIVNAYYNFTVEIAVLCGANLTRAEEELKESLEFEIKLAKISVSDEDRSDSTAFYNPMNVRELSKQYPSILWKEYFNSILQPIVIDDEELIIVTVLDYFKEFEKLIKNTRSKRVLANYLLCRALQEDVDLLTNAFRNSKMKLSTIVNGPVERQVQWKECLDMVSSELEFIIGALYVRKYFSPESKKKAEELAVDIEQQFKAMLQEIDWMDEDTRKLALDKLASIKNFIGYPKELTDEKKLDEFFQKLEVNPNNYIKAAGNISIFWSQYYFGQLRQSVNKADWKTHSDVTVVEAFYLVEENSVLFPAANLQDIYFHKDRPQYMNYALTGFIVGHEITHGFDAVGSQYDKNGEPKNWWTPDTEKKFLEKADCIIKQYGNYIAKEVDLKVNGTSTQEENIGDNGGMRLSYLAYQNWVERNGPEPTLPGLSYSPSQLFWISSASMWCKKQTPEYLKDYITYDPHSPPEFRVIGTNSNRPEFTKDFHCPPGSAMNPDKKCSIW